MLFQLFVGLLAIGLLVANLIVVLRRYKYEKDKGFPYTREQCK